MNKRGWLHIVAACALWLVSAAHAEDLSSLAAIHVREIRLQGPALIEPAVLADVLPRYQGREVSADELLQLAQWLTTHLVERGYVNSGVVLPDQKIDAGIVYFQVIGGRIERIEVSGNRSLPDRYIAERLANHSQAVFNINDAVRQLRQLERDPRIKKLNAELKPSVERGAALLNVDVEEAPMYGASVGVDNYISPNVGAIEAVVDAYHLNVIGFGDALTGGLRYAEGYTGVSAAYAMPTNANGGLLTLAFDRSASEIVTAPFDQLDIEGESTGYGLMFRQPVFHSDTTDLALGIGLRLERVQSYLLGEPFAFAVADEDGASNVTMVQLTQEWVRRDEARVLALRSSFNVGIEALDATVGDGVAEEGDAEFIEWLLQGEWLQKLEWRNSVVGVKGLLHLSNDTLPSSRKYALGGAHNVRGYRENLFTRDCGWMASVEWTVPVFRLPLKWITHTQDQGQVSIAPFADYGYAWDYYDDINEPVDVASVGLGVQWQMGANSSASLRIAKALIEHDTGAIDEVLQDDGVHFSVRVGF
jgi:hemolysin activation/secretion protein